MSSTEDAVIYDPDTCQAVAVPVERLGALVTTPMQIVQRLTNDTEPRPHARLISIEHTQPVTEANFENRSVPSSADPYHGRLVSVSHPREHIQNAAAQEAYRVRDLRLIDTELLELACTGRLHKPYSRVAGSRIAIASRSERESSQTSDARDNETAQATEHKLTADGKLTADQQEWLDAKTATRFRFPRAPKQAEGEESVQDDTRDTEAKDGAEADDGAEEDGADEEEEEADVGAELSQESGDDAEVEKAAGLFASIRKEAKDAQEVARRWEEELEAYEAQRSHAAGNAAVMHVKGASGVVEAVAEDACTRASGDWMHGQTKKSEGGSDGWSKKLSERDSEHAPLASEEMRQVKRDLEQQLADLSGAILAGGGFSACETSDARRWHQLRHKILLQQDHIAQAEAREGNERQERRAAERLAAQAARAVVPPQTAIGHLMSAFDLLLRHERGEGRVEVGDEEARRSLTQKLTDQLRAGADKAKQHANALLEFYLTESRVRAVTDPFMHPRLEFRDYYDDPVAISGSLNVLFVGPAPVSSIQSVTRSRLACWHGAYGRIIKEPPDGGGGAFLLFTSKHTFLAKHQASVELRLDKARFSMFASPSDGKAACEAMSGGAVLRVEDTDDGRDTSPTTLLFLRFRKTSSRDTWLGELKAARGRAQQARRREAGPTPSIQARAERRPAPSSLSVLIQQGADVNVAGSNGLTPLHLAVNCASLPSLKELLCTRGLTLNPRSDAGITPLKLALMNDDGSDRRKQVVKALLDAGAENDTARIMF